MEAPDSGRWQVTTETSTYLLDLDARLVTRVPDAGAGTPDGLSGVSIASLRRDHEPIPLIELVRCEPGQPMRVLLDVREDGISTMRTTTTVRNIRKLDGLAADNSHMK